MNEEIVNNSIKHCIICDNKKYGEFININNNKYHLCCIEQLQQENQQLKDRIDKAIIYIATQKTKLYKKRNKPGLFNLINIEKMLLGKVKE